MTDHYENIRRALAMGPTPIVQNNFPEFTVIWIRGRS